MAGATPTARTLERMRRLGYPAQVVEKWLPGKRKNPRTGQLEDTPYGVRKDLFGCIDIVVLDGQPGSLGVQACAASGLASRVDKARAIPELVMWLLAGNRWQCWGWLYLDGSDLQERVVAAGPGRASTPSLSMAEEANPR